MAGQVRVPPETMDYHRITEDNDSEGDNKKDITQTEKKQETRRKKVETHQKQRRIRSKTAAKAKGYPKPLKKDHKGNF